MLGLLDFAPTRVKYLLLQTSPSLCKVVGIWRRAQRKPPWLSRGSSLAGLPTEGVLGQGGGGCGSDGVGVGPGADLVA